jgi:hypothetical protein
MISIRTFIESKRPIYVQVAPSTLAKVKDDVVFNWSGVNPIAQEPQLLAPKTSEEVNRLYQFI